MAEYITCPGCVGAGTGCSMCGGTGTIPKPQPRPKPQK